VTKSAARQQVKALAAIAKALAVVPRASHLSSVIVFGASARGMKFFAKTTNFVADANISVLLCWRLHCYLSAWLSPSLMPLTSRRQATAAEKYTTMEKVTAGFTR